MASFQVNSQMRLQRFKRCKCQIALAIALTSAAVITATTAKAQHGGHDATFTGPGAHAANMPADGHMSGHSHMHPSPVGVMGAHVLVKGQAMLMYTPMLMKMDGSRIGTRRVSPEEIVTTVPNRFEPLPTLRIAPEEMSMEMHMFGAMYGVNDSITVMWMTSYVEKRMTLITFQGGMGTTRLGITEGSTEGIAGTPPSQWLSSYGRAMATGSTARFAYRSPPDRPRRVDAC
jgi:hypothetical protein